MCKKKKYNKFTVIIGVILIIIINYAVGESFLRFCVYSKNKIFAPIKKAQYFARYDSDNYQKLNALFLLGDSKTKSSYPHPELGWTGNFSETSYRHFNENKIEGRKVVLLFGDSFANCMNSPITLENLLEKNKVFTKSYHLLNYAVDGYGVDQIYILFNKVIKIYDNPIVFFTFTTIDMDRTVVQLAGQQKPVFHIKGDSLQLNKPLQLSIDTFLEKYPPTINSYLLSFLGNGFHLVWQNFFCKDKSVFGDSEKRIGPIKKLNGRLISDAINLLNLSNIKYKVIVFHTRWRGESPIDRDDWRDKFLKNLFNELSVVPVWSKSIIQKDALENNKPYHYYFLTDGHPAQPYIYLVYDEIVRFLNVEN